MEEVVMLKVKYLKVKFPMIPDIYAFNHPVRLKGLTSLLGLKSPPEKRSCYTLASQVAQR